MGKVDMQILKDRGDWLQHRRRYIGGSDVAAIVNLNPYKSNLQLWREKTGQAEPEDISEKPYVKYGTEAEEHLRALFALDYPQYIVQYQENNSFVNSAYPFAAASLDGWLIDPDGRLGVLEIKTTTISGAVQFEKWKDRIPDNYYCQVLFYMAVIEASFAELTAQLKWERDSDVYCQVRRYHIERSDVEDDIKMLMGEARRFWSSVESLQEPPQMLPQI